MFPDPKTEEQIRRFERYWSRHPESLAFARLADAYRKAGRPKRALEVLEEGFRRHPGYVTAHIVKARALLDLGRNDAARAAFRRVLELDPQNLVALRALERIGGESGAADAPGAAPDRAGEGKEPAARDVREEPAAGDVRGEPREREPIRERKPAPEPEAEPEPQPETEPEPRREEEAQARPPSAGTSPADVVVTVTMADLLVRQGLYDEAVGVYERLLEARPDDAQIRERLDAAKRLAAGRVPAIGRRLEASETSGAPDADEGGMTIREYLVRLTEGRAPAPDSGFPDTVSEWLEGGGASRARGTGCESES